MTKIIEAKAVISAADHTGNVFDKIAAKFKGVEKTAKALNGIKAPKFSGDLMEELKRLNLSEKQLQGVRKGMADFNRDLLATRPKFDHYARAHRDWADNQVRHWRAVKVATDDAREAQQKFMKGGGPGAAARAAAPWIGAGAVGYYGGRAARFAFDKSKEANRETTKQRQAGLTQAQSDDIAAEAERQSKNFPSISQTELRSAGREAVMQMGSQEAGMSMMPAIGKFMTTGKVLWGSDKIEEQTRKALQVLDTRQITDPARASSLLNELVKSSQVEGGPDFQASDLRTALRQGRIMTQGQSDRFITGVLPQMGVDMGYAAAGTGLMSAHSALIGGKQKKEAAGFQTKVGLRDEKGLVGKDMFTRDVDKWVDTHLIPTMEKQKVDVNDPAAVGEFLGKFLTRTPADALGNLVTGRQQRQRREEQRKLAKGMDGAEELHKRDVGVALEAVNTQLTNMASSAKMAEASIAGLNKAMELIQQAGQKFNEPGGWFDKGKKQLEQETKDAQAVGGAVKSIFDKDKAVSDAGRNWIEKNTPFGRGTPNVSSRAGGPKSIGETSRWPSAAAPVPYSPGSGISGNFSPASQSWSDFFSPGSARLGKKKFVPPSFATPAVSDTMTYGTGVGAGAPAQSQPTVAVTGTISGEGKLVLEINAGSSLIDVVKRAEAAISLAGQIGGNGPGSTGKSSPDAAAPRPSTGFNGVP